LRYLFWDEESRYIKTFKLDSFVEREGKMETTRKCRTPSSISIFKKMTTDLNNDLQLISSNTLGSYLYEIRGRLSPFRLVLHKQ